ncbi:hypothetical protein HS7_12160 [Sulfolobales archaeon HS-7]|nr:hypothetical protein HS7_12160 [Sulfolobales archaeon HS-7]
MIRAIISILASIVISYATLILLPITLFAVAIGIPLFLIKPRYSGIYGFAIGLLTSLSIYLLYSPSAVYQLSVRTGEIIGIPGSVLIILYPLIYAVIAGLSSLLFSGIYEIAKNIGNRR